MSNKFSDMIIEGLNRSRVDEGDAKNQILKTEGTTSSDIATPDGKVGSVKIQKDKEFLCPSCGGKDVIIKDGKFHCTGCENEWGVEGTNERKSISVSEDSVNEAAKYRVGKKFTSPDMDFEVKKINKNGTINIWVEQDNKSYDVEISDLELLRPVEVKE